MLYGGGRVNACIPAAPTAACVMNCLLTFVYPKEDSKNGAMYVARRCKLAVKVTHICHMKAFFLQNKYTNCKGIKNNTNSGQTTGIQEELGTTCK
jgi:hypothetical protein